MAGKRFVPIKLGQRDKRPAWLADYSSWRLFFYSLALTLLLAALGLVLVVWRQPHILQGDARWAEVRALFLPAGLAGGLTLGVILLQLVKATWPTLTAVARAVQHGLRWGWAVAGWAAESLGTVLAWLDGVVLRPAIRRLFFLLRIAANIIVQALLKPARSVLLSAVLGLRALLEWGLSVVVRLADSWVIGPARWLLGALANRLIRPASHVLLQAVALLFGLLARATARLATVLALLVRSVVLQPLRLVGQGFGRLAIRLTQSVGRAFRSLGRSLAAAARGGGWLAARLAAGMGRVLRDAYRKLTPLVLFRLAVVGAAAAAGAALAVAVWRYPGWLVGSAPRNALILLFSPAVLLSLTAAGAAAAVWNDELAQLGRGLGLAGWAAVQAALAGLRGVLRLLGHAARAVWAGVLAVAASLLRLIIVRPLWIVLDLAHRAARWVGRALVGLGWLLARHVLAALGAGLRAAAALVLGLAVAMGRAIGAVVARALAWVGWAVARVAGPAGRLAVSFLWFIVVRPVRLTLGLVRTAAYGVGQILAGLGRWLFRRVLAPLGAGLRAVVALAAGAMRWLAHGFLAGLKAAGLALVRIVIAPVTSFGLTVLRGADRRLFQAARALNRWLLKPLTDRGMPFPAANVGLIAACAVLVLAGRNVFPPVACRLGVQPMCPPAPCAAPEGAILVSFYSSNTKQNWITTVTETFNAGDHTTASGRPIFVCVTHGTSGGQQLGLRNGEIEPTAWSPGDESWVESVNQLWQDRHGRSLVSSPCLPTVVSPIGFAMWRSMAEAMGWPDKPINWDDLVELAADPQGWGRYGHAEWGAFKFGHTHPDQSNSGLLILAALAHDVHSQAAPLTVELVDSQAFETAMREVELQTDHYGIQSRDLINLMIGQGSDFLHAVNTTEAETLRTNIERSAELPQPLAFVFPARGTYWTEQPYCVLEAPWVSDEQREAARLYGDYLRAPAQQVLAPANYLRPLDPGLPLSGPFSLENGTDPRVTPSLVPALESPGSDVAAMVKDIFHRTKKKATIVILLDVSGSMQGEPMASAIDATIDFLRQLDRDDEVYVYAFGNRVSAVGPGGPAREVEEPLNEALNSLTAVGQTALYDAVCQGSQQIGRLRAEHEAAGEGRLYGVVLLSDGEDTASGATDTAMRACLAPSGPQRTKVFAIQYGNDADEDVLADIASRTLGKLFVAEASSIADVYLAISAEQ